MNRKILTTSLLCASVLSFSSFAAKNTGVLEGTYVPVKGHSTSREVSRYAMGETPRQVGKYKLVLKREGWNLLSAEEKQRIRKKLVIKGEYTGIMDVNTMTVDHVMVNEEKSGALYTQDDFLVPSQGDGTCSTGKPLAGIEQLNFVSGSGDFHNLDGGTLYLAAQLNNCPGQDKFLKNEFELMVEEGSLTFSATE